jgi:hypothetical protein
MTKFFATPDNPSGHRLEDLLGEVQKELMRRSNKIVSDRRAEARKVLENNIEILGMLTRCIALAEESTRAVNSIGPAHGPGDPPRIGEP